jgi:hypothetical protein
MKKQISILLVFLFSIIAVDQAGNHFFTPAKANNIIRTHIDSNNLDTFPHYLPEEVGMNSATLTRIDSIVKDGIADRVFPELYL